jgi:hypothetical protein
VSSPVPSFRIRRSGRLESPIKGEDATEENAMPPKFKVGEVVFIKPAVRQNVPGGLYEVIKVLPDHNGEREYRIKSANEPYERIARESELTRA